MPKYIIKSTHSIFDMQIGQQCPYEPIAQTQIVGYPATSCLSRMENIRPIKNPALKC